MTKRASAAEKNEEALLYSRGVVEVVAVARWYGAVRFSQHARSGRGMAKHFSFYLIYIKASAWNARIYHRNYNRQIYVLPSAASGRSNQPKSRRHLKIKIGGASCEKHQYKNLVARNGGHKDAGHGDGAEALGGIFTGM